MPLRKYICPMIGTGAGAATDNPDDFGDPFRPSLRDLFDARRVSWRATDLRTYEQWRDRTGYALIEADIRDTLHDECLLQPNVIEIKAGITEEQVRNRIGSGDAETFESADPELFVRRVAAKRQRDFTAAKRTDRGLR